MKVLDDNLYQKNDIFDVDEALPTAYLTISPPPLPPPSAATSAMTKNG